MADINFSLTCVLQPHTIVRIKHTFGDCQLAFESTHQKKRSNRLYVQVFESENRKMSIYQPSGTKLPENTINHCVIMVRDGETLESKIYNDRHSAIKMLNIRVYTECGRLMKLKKLDNSVTKIMMAAALPDKPDYLYCYFMIDLQ